MKHEMDTVLTRREVLVRMASAIVVPGALAGFAAIKQLNTPVLNAVSNFNDEVQGTLFSPDRLAQSYESSEISKPFRYNGILPQAYVPKLDPNTWRLALSGQISHNAPLSLQTLRALPQHAQITRLICIEGWSAIGKWSGPLLQDVLMLIGADINAKYVSFECADGYFTSIDVSSALHSQTILALDFLDRPLTPEFGAPARLRIPTKLGFKNAKNIVALSITNEFPSGYWEKQGYNWFAGL